MKKSKTLLLMALICAVFAGLTVLFALLYRHTEAEGYQVLSVTFLTVFYHFAMRLFVGEIMTLIFRRRSFHYGAAWFRPKRFEPALYRFLRVAKWKRFIITAKPEQFDSRVRTLSELRFYITQAEVVHECIAVFSFLPMLLIVPFGEPWVFGITSVMAALIDTVFVIVQRYNRPRVEWLMRKSSGNM